MRNSSLISLRSLIFLSLSLCIGVLAARAQSQTTIGLGFFGAFTGATSGNGTVQSPANQAGGIFELRYLANPLMGYELTYSYNRANQSYSTSSFEQGVKAGAHEITADWVVSLHILDFRPFVLAGAGVIDFRPDTDQEGVSSDAQAVFVYGGGVDWGLLPHLGLRAQYRGNLYHAPDLLKAATSTDAFAHSSEPVVGAYFRF
ncbi:MAG TPA: outer membrane beta-barrel protein [Acidobacteriaceae bacterium]|nr:outer membrane beta-barrel protein [Acidobacteriaceae bacterium]